MILSDFVLIDTIGDSPLDHVYFAEVTVTSTTGMLWWKKIHVVRRNISRNFGGLWFFLHDGKYTPEFQAEELERSYRARKLLDAT
jgi:hypothetical protein